MRGPSRISGFLFITQLDDAAVRHGSVVLRRPWSYIDRDFVIHNVHSTPLSILIVFSKVHRGKGATVLIMAVSVLIMQFSFFVFFATRTGELSVQRASLRAQNASFRAVTRLLGVTTIVY